jgi:hydrogenase-4 component B
MNNFELLMILILPMIGTMISFYIGHYSERWRDVINTFVTGINLLMISMMFPEIQHHTTHLYIKDIMGVGLHLKLDLFRYVFVWVTAFVWFLTTMYSTQYLIRYKNRNRYYGFFMATYASTIGIFISENLLNLFTFFEIMSLASYALVIHDEDEYSHEAGKSYVSMALAGGLFLLMGLLLLYYYTDTLNISDFVHGMGDIGNVKYVIFTLIFIGFGVKASVIPLHSWLPKAHPAAPTPASAILSGILIKTGLFGIMILVLKLMAGDPYVPYILVILGCVNILHGGVLAVMQRNIKRILAYSSMSQAGYIMVGIGISGVLGHHGGLAITATLYHVFNHAIFKVLLFMGVGIIYVILHELSINKIAGFGRNKIYLRFIFMLGFLAIIGMPGTNGFISKTLIHEAIVEARHEHAALFFSVVESVFVLGGSLTIAYLLKIFITVFWEHNEEFYGQYKHHVKKRALFPMAILGVAIIYIGLNPGILFKYMSEAAMIFGVDHPHEPVFYNVETIKGFLLPFALGVLIYVGFVRGTLLQEQEDGKKIYVNPSLNWIELENDVYRPVISLVFLFTSTILRIIDRGVIHFFIALKNSFFKFLHIEVNYRRFNVQEQTIEVANMSMDKFNSGKEQAVERAQSFIEWEKSTYRETVEKSQNKIKSIKEVFALTGAHLNSLVYTVLTFIFVLVMVLILMVRS